MKTRALISPLGKPDTPEFIRAAVDSKALHAG
jgi:hypothetical protein